MSDEHTEATPLSLYRAALDIRVWLRRWCGGLRSVPYYDALDPSYTKTKQGLALVLYQNRPLAVSSPLGSFWVSGGGSVYNGKWRETAALFLGLEELCPKLITQRGDIGPIFGITWFQHLELDEAVWSPPEPVNSLVLDPLSPRRPWTQDEFWLFQRWVTIQRALETM